MARLFVLLIISVVVFCPRANACGWSEEDYEPNYLFTSNLLSDQSLAKYFPGTIECEDCQALINSATIAEWKARFPNSAENDIAQGLFAGLTKANLQQLKSGTNPLPGNTFYDEILSNNSIEYLAYLDFIFQENTTVPELVGTYTWEEGEKDFTKLKQLFTQAKERFSETEDAFLKQRYIFQMVKLLHLTTNYDDAIELYETSYSSGKYPHTLIYYRTLGYYAGSQRKRGDTNLAKYLFAKIFDECLPMRYRAYKDFKFIDQESGEWQKSLALAKSRSEKSAMLIAKNIYDVQIDVEALKNLYESDSSSGRLELALIKQLNNFHFNYYIDALDNKVELEPSVLINEFTINREIVPVTKAVTGNWFSRVWASIINFFKNLFGSKDSGKVKWLDETPDINYESFSFKEEWIPELIQLLDRIIKENKVKNPDLYILAKGYLEVAYGQFSDGQKSLITLDKSERPGIAQISNYILLWSKVLSDQKLTENLENSIINYCKKHPQSNALLKELFRRYFAEKQYDKAGLVFHKSGISNYFTYNLSEEELQALIKLGNKKLSKNFIGYFGQNDISQLKSDYARRLFLQGDFEGAVKIKNEELPAGEGETVTYSDLAKWNKQGTAESYLRIANFLSISPALYYNSIPCYNYYPGYNGSAFYPFNIKGLTETIQNREHYMGKINYSTDLAEFYYRKVSELRKTDEEKAKALVSAQMVAMRDKYALRNKYEKDAVKIDKGGYYSELKEKYPNTQIVKDLSNSCSFMRNEEITYY